MSELTPRGATPGASVSSGTRPSVIQLVFREKGALYAAYMPLLTEGGLFVPSRYSREVGTNRPPSVNSGM